MNEELLKYVPKVHFEQIPIKNLVSNQDYQRTLSMKHVTKAANNFDLYQVNPVKVSRRNGVNYVFNGQHTIEIVAMVSGSRETPVWCMIYDDLEYSHEADIFANQMKYVKTLVPMEIFQANIEAGNSKQIIIKELVESFNLRIGPAAVPGSIAAVGSLEKIYDKFGYEMLERVLNLIIGIWEGDQQSLGSSVLLGTAKLLDAYGDTISDETFRERLSAYSIKEICRNAKDKHNGTLGFAETLLVFFNKRTRNPVSFEKLYSKKNKVSRKSAEPESDEPNLFSEAEDTSESIENL